MIPWMFDAVAFAEKAATIAKDDCTPRGFIWDGTNAFPFSCYDYSSPNNGFHGCKSGYHVVDADMGWGLTIFR